jgi:hypothetical protein
MLDMVEIKMSEFDEVVIVMIALLATIVFVLSHAGIIRF